MFSRWLLRGGKIELPAALAPFEVVMFGGEPDYEKAIAFDRAHQRAARMQDAEKTAAYFRNDRSMIAQRSLKRRQARLEGMVTGEERKTKTLRNA